jgi:hypothetical protein
MKKVQQRAMRVEYRLLDRLAAPLLKPSFAAIRVIVFNPYHFREIILAWLRIALLPFTKPRHRPIVRVP